MKALIHRGPGFKNACSRIFSSESVCSVQAEIPHLLAALSSAKFLREQGESIVNHRKKHPEGEKAYRLFDAHPNGVRNVVLAPTA